MTQDNENINPSKGNKTCFERFPELRDKKLFAAQLRTLADLLEQDKIISATFYADRNGVSPLYPDGFSANFCNCSEDDYKCFLEDVREGIMHDARMWFGWGKGF